MNVFSEYRVYQYMVKAKNQTYRDPQSRVVISTLDPISYVAYNGGDEAVQVSLLRTWRCMGNTSQLSPCPSPLDKINPLDESKGVTN